MRDGATNTAALFHPTAKDKSEMEYLSELRLILEIVYANPFLTLTLSCVAALWILCRRS